MTREEPAKKKPDEEEDEEESSSSSEESESESEEESEPERAVAPVSPAAPSRSESAMARTDIGPLLARSAEARRGSKEESPGTRQVVVAAAANAAATAGQPFAVDDARALRDNETNRRIEGKHSKGHMIKKAAGRLAIGVLENLFG